MTSRNGMRILVACEFSGAVRSAFDRLGHDAWSCDLLDSERPGKHIKGNVLDILENDWDLLIAHPPCTYLSNSGSRWLWNEDGTRNKTRWKSMRESSIFFSSLLNAPVPHVCVENPIMHKYGKNLIGRKYDQIVQPYQFGHAETKATCFWLKSLPPLHPVTDLKRETYKKTHKERNRLHYLPPSADRWKLRSTTFSGIAAAMALQWSNNLKEWKT